MGGTAQRLYKIMQQQLTISPRKVLKKKKTLQHDIIIILLAATACNEKERWRNSTKEGEDEI